MAPSDHIDRRTVMTRGAAAAAGLLVAGCGGSAVASGTGGGMATPAPAPAPMPSSSPTPAPESGLHAVAARRNLSFGTCLAYAAPDADAGSLSNPRFDALATRDCGIAVPENALKWQAIRPAPDRFDFARFDAVLGQAEARGFAMRGHTLLWHYDRWFPQWLVDYDFGTAPRAEAERILQTHIRTVCARYGRRILSYDVVNEAVDPADGSLRSTALSRAMGGVEPVLDLAFRTAREAAPHAELVYNDYMSWEVGNEKHREGVLRLLEGFKRRGTPVDALGVQSHIGVFSPTPSIDRLVAQLTPAWRGFLDQVVAMGYRLVVTEFDVRDKGLAADIASRDRGVADFARGYLDIMLSYPVLNDVLAWGLTDRYSWLRTFEPRGDGLVTRGLPYDIDLAPKPLYAAIRDALAAAPNRPPRPTRA